MWSKCDQTAFPVTETLDSIRDLSPYGIMPPIVFDTVLVDTYCSKIAEYLGFYAAGFTSCYGLLFCSHSFTELLCHRASTLGSLHQLPVSYEATWLLPRLIFHKLVMPSLARRANRKNPLRSAQRGRFKVLLSIFIFYRTPPP
jgi:hypothetical protein